jgi:hypothetical protein
MNDEVLEYLCGAFCDLLLYGEVIHSVRPFVIRRPAGVGFLFSVSAGEFQLFSLCMNISRIHILRYVCSYMYAPRSDKGSFSKSPSDKCYWRIRWVMFVFDHCYLPLAVIQLIHCIRYKSSLILPTGPINRWSIFEILLEDVALGWIQLPERPGV